MNAWGISAQDASEFLTRLTNIARSTGAEINTLQEALIRSGPSMRELGYSADQTATFFAQMTAQGERGAGVIRGLPSVVKKLSEAVAEGKFPSLQAAWDGLIHAVQRFLQLGDKVGALKLLEQFVPPASAGILLEDIANKTLDVASAMRTIGGVNQPLSEAVEHTRSLGEALEIVGQQASAALAPLGQKLAGALVGASGHIGEWLKDNQGKIASWAVAAETTFLTVMAQAAKFMADLINSVGGLLEVFKDAAVGVAMGVLQTIKAISEPLSHLPGRFGQPFKDAIRDVDAAMGPLHKAFDFNLPAAIDKATGKVDAFANTTVPNLNAQLKQMLTEFQFGQDIGKAVEENIGGHLTNALQAAKEANGKASESPIGAMLLGTPAQQQEVRDRLHKLGIDITTGPNGIITAIHYASDKVKEQFEKWFKELAEGDHKVQLTPVGPDGRPIEGPADLVPPGPSGVPLSQQPVPGPAYPTPGAPSTPGAPPSPAAPPPPPPAAPSSANLSQWLANRLAAAGIPPDEIRGILAMNVVEGGASDPKSLLGFTESQAHGPEGHVQAFLKQWNDLSRRPAGGAIPGVSATGQVTDWTAFMKWIRDKIVGQGGVVDWQGNQQEPPEQYLAKLMAALGRVRDAGGGAGYSGGGSAWVPGEGDGDTVPAMLTPGEYVVRRGQAQKHRRLLDAINSGIADAGGGCALCGGGHPTTFHQAAAAVRTFGQGGDVGGVAQVIWSDDEDPQVRAAHGDAGVGVLHGRVVSGGPGSPYSDETNPPGQGFAGHHGHVHTTFNADPFTGQPYNQVPAGTNTGLGEWSKFPPWVKRLGDMYGLDAKTYPGHQEWAGANHGIDWYPRGKQDMSGGSYTHQDHVTLSTFANAAIAVGSGQGTFGGVVPTGYGGIPAAPGGGPSGGPTGGPVGGGSPTAPGSAGPVGSFPLGQSVGGVDMPPVPTPGMSLEQYRSWASSTAHYNQDNQRNQRELADAQAKLAAAQAAAAPLQEDYNRKLEAWNKLRAENPAAADLSGQQYKELQEAYDKAKGKTDEVARLQQQIADLQNRIADADIKGPPQPPKPEKGGQTPFDKDASTLGAGLVRGVLQEMGFPDVFGKAITQWGSWKLGMGRALGWGLEFLHNKGLLGDGGQQPQGVATNLGAGAVTDLGLPRQATNAVLSSQTTTDPETGSNVTTAGWASGDIGGPTMGALVNNLPHILVGLHAQQQQRTQNGAITASMATTNRPATAPTGPTDARTVTYINHNSGVMSPSEIGYTVAKNVDSHSRWWGAAPTLVNIS